MFKKLLLASLILGLTGCRSVAFANFDSSTDMQTLSVSAAVLQVQNCLKAVDGSDGTGVTKIVAKTNVGIGLTNPSASLHIRGAGTTTGFIVRLSDSTPTDRLVVLDNGNVGIGTTAPLGLLQVGTSPGAGLTVLANGYVGINNTKPTAALMIGSAIVGYTNRGDPASSDYSTGDFTKDSAWHDLDLSSIVSPGASVVYLTVDAADNVGGKSVKFKKKGNSNDFNIGSFVTQAANAPFRADLVVSCNTAQIIEYYIVAGTYTNFTLTVKGWQ